MTELVLVHGWGLAPSLWSPLMAALNRPKHQCADLGFFGTPATPLVKNPLVVTHSMGLLWALTHLPQPWSGLVCINGFSRFSAMDGFPGVEPRILGRMQARLPHDPSAVLAEFLRRCGQSEPVTQGIDPEALAQGLVALEQGDKREALARLVCPMIAITGSADPIISVAHAKSCFEGKPLVVIEGAGHLMPLTHTAWLAHRLSSVLKGDWSL